MAFEMIVTATLSTAAAVVGAVGLDRISLRRSRHTAREQQQREAAGAFGDVMRQIRKLLRRSQYEQLTPDAWAEAITRLGKVDDDFAQRLPAAWGHLRRSVRGAVGEYTGGVAMSDIDACMREHPLALPDPKWLNNALEYCDYTCHRIQQWQDAPYMPCPFLAYDPWLARATV